MLREVTVDIPDKIWGRGQNILFNLGVKQAMLNCSSFVTCCYWSVGLGPKYEAWQLSSPLTGVVCKSHLVKAKS